MKRKFKKSENNNKNLVIQIKKLNIKHLNEIKRNNC